MGRISDILYNTVKHALVLKHRLQSYYPCFFDYIYRIDTTRGIVTDDHCVRSKLCKHNVFYMISAWNCETSRYHKLLLHGRLIATTIGADKWVSMSNRDLIRLLISLYDEHSTVNSNILAITIGDKDVTCLFTDMRSSLSVPGNVTAAAIVLAHQYLEYGEPPPYSAIPNVFALQVILENMNLQGDTDDNTDSSDTDTDTNGEYQGRGAPEGGEGAAENKVAGARQDREDLECYDGSGHCGGDRDGLGVRTGDDGAYGTENKYSDGVRITSGNVHGVLCTGVSVPDNTDTARGQPVHIGSTYQSPPTWPGWNSPVTIVDYDLQEKQIVGHTLLF